MTSDNNKSDEINLKILYNKDGEFDYEQVKNVARRIGSGEFEITRLAPREEQGRNSGGRRNVEASIIAGAEARASRAASQDANRLEMRELSRTNRLKHISNDTLKADSYKVSKSVNILGNDSSKLIKSSAYFLCAKCSKSRKTETNSFRVKSVICQLKPAKPNLSKVKKGN